MKDVVLAVGFSSHGTEELSEPYRGEVSEMRGGMGDWSDAKVKAATHDATQTESETGGSGGTEPRPFLGDIEEGKDDQWE